MLEDATLGVVALISKKLLRLHSESNSLYILSGIFAKQWLSLAVGNSPSIVFRMTGNYIIDVL